jgi:hippurate hydrolase
MVNRTFANVLFGVVLLLTGSNVGSAQQISSLSEERYRYLHSHPELSGQEVNTSAYLKRALSKAGFTIVDSLGIHSFAGIFYNGKGPVVMYRTDMDALPIVEETGCSFAPGAAIESDKPIVGMHACGHDVHMTTWLEVAEQLIQQKNTWKGTVIFLAQSSEEVGQGARAVLASENFKKLPKADYNIAFHNTPELSSGTVGFCDGYAFAAVDMMNITVKGKGGHGAEPFRAVDPVLLAAYLVTELQSIVSRNLPPNDPAVITVGAIHGGTVGNIIPSEVELKLTIRSYSEESRKKILQRIEDIGNGLAASAGLDTSNYPIYTLLDMSIPSVYNTPEMGKLLANAFQGMNIPTSLMIPKMIGEDFGVYGCSKQIRSYMLWIGTTSTNQDDCPDLENCFTGKLHTADYFPDYTVTIPMAVKTMRTALVSLFTTRPIPITHSVSPSLDKTKQ